MEITRQNKLKYFSAHIGAKITDPEWLDDISYPLVGIDIETDFKNIWYRDSPMGTINSNVDGFVLQLKPINSISESEAIEVARLFLNYSLGGQRRNDWTVQKLENENIKVILDDNHYHHEIIIGVKTGSIWSIDNNKPSQYKLKATPWDYLRSKGYATEWNGLSVEALIKCGWLELINIES